MVIPCYNKVRYIGGMFESIIAQEWDNITLVLVNDGSTDGTREVIAEYEPKFRARGFEVIIIDQENAGVCAAAKTGLEQVTGDYVCLVDADDELDPAYVSTMAGWLDEHLECDFAACRGISYTGEGAEKVFAEGYPAPISSSNPFLAEQYFLGVIRPTVWIYMVRVSYLHHCRIVQTYYTDTKGSHEPGYILPLLLYGGKLKFFSKRLYHFNKNGEGHSRSGSYEKTQAFQDEYDRLCHLVIATLPDAVADDTRKQWLANVSRISKAIRLYPPSQILDGAIYETQALDQVLTCFNAYFAENDYVSRACVRGYETLFIRAIVLSLTGHRRDDSLRAPLGRVIGYGVLGKAARKLLPLLQGSALEPTELWDIAGDGVSVKKPCFDGLNETDIVLIFPVGKVEAALRETMAEMPCRVFYHADIFDWISLTRFGRYFDKGQGVR